MPFKSKAQQGYMFANNPKVAKEMASKMSSKSFKKLPDKKKKASTVSTMLAALREMGK